MRACHAEKEDNSDSKTRNTITMIDQDLITVWTAEIVAAKSNRLYRDTVSDNMGIRVSTASTRVIFACSW